MICVFCNYDLPSEMMAEIAGLDSMCSSECDGRAVVEAKCPRCAKVFWRKWLDVSYGVRDLRAAGYEYVSWAAETPKAPEFEKVSGGYLVLDEDTLFTVNIVIADSNSYPGLLARATYGMSSDIEIARDAINLDVPVWQKVGDIQQIKYRLPKESEGRRRLSEHLVDLTGNKNHLEI